MRHTIINNGGEVHFQTKMTRLVMDEKNSQVVGVIAEEFVNGIYLEKEFCGPVILATGHSARDVYHYLDEAKVELEAKGIAVGVRLEHPSQLIGCRICNGDSGRRTWSLFFLYVPWWFCDTGSDR